MHLLINLLKGAMKNSICKAFSNQDSNQHCISPNKIIDKHQTTGDPLLLLPLSQAKVISQDHSLQRVIRLSQHVELKRKVEALVTSGMIMTKLKSIKKPNNSNSN